MNPYGKKRKSFFSKGRDVESSSKQKKEKNRAGFRSSTLTLSAFHGSQSHQVNNDIRSQPLLHENRSQTLLSNQEEQDNAEESIDELASKLLDDTTVEQLGADPGRRLSQIGLHPGNSGMSAPLTFDASNKSINTKNLPQLPSMLFNGDDVWAMKGSPVTTSTSCTNIMQFVNEPDNTPLAPPNMLKNASTHSRNASTPTIPRKSSRRKSKKTKSNIASPKKPSRGRGAHSRKLSKSISTPMLLSNTNHTTNVGLEINDKIASMLAATAALKGPPPPIDGTLLQGPLVTPKKRLIKENNAFLAKVKSLGGIFRKKHDPLRDPLLDGSLITDGEIRLNEGKNLENRGKTAILTGRRKINIARKPIADDGKSLKSTKSNDKEDPFSDRPSLGKRRMTTNDLEYYHFGFEDSDEDIEFGEEAEDGVDSDVNTSTDELMISELPPMPRSLATMPNLMKSMTSDLAYTRSNSIMLSSPPLDESTPRLRLEPFIKNGKKTLKSVPVEYHSFFDADASIGSPSSRMNIQKEPIVNCFEDDLSLDELTTEPRYRRASKLGYADFDFAPSGRRKKHPSPSKATLDGWAVVFDQRPPNATSGARVFTADTGLPDSCMLAPRDPNRASYYSEHSHKSSMDRSHQSVPSLTKLSTHRQSLGSITGSPKRNSRHSIISIYRQSENHNSRDSSNRNSRAFGAESASDLEIDELQDPAYDNHPMGI